MQPVTHLAWHLQRGGQTGERYEGEHENYVRHGPGIGTLAQKLSYNLAVGSVSPSVLFIWRRLVVSGLASLLSTGERRWVITNIFFCLRRISNAFPFSLSSFLVLVTYRNGDTFVGKFENNMKQGVGMRKARLCWVGMEWKGGVCDYGLARGT